MDSNTPFDDDSSETKSVIMQATFDTLQEYGYGGLSISRIAERSELSKSSVYHHYDDKDELLYEFLNKLVDQLEADFSFSEFSDPVIALEVLLVEGIRGELPPSYEDNCGVDELPPNRVEAPESVGAFVELQAQAVHDRVYRERMAELDQTLKDHLEQTIESGIDQGVFREVDPEMVAESLLTLIMGAIVRRSTSENVAMSDVHTITLDCIESYLLRDGVTLRRDP